MMLVGAPAKPMALSWFNLFMKRRSLAGCAIRRICETQEMLDSCVDKGITADIEMIPIQKINTAYERPLKSDVSL